MPLASSRVLRPELIGCLMLLSAQSLKCCGRWPYCAEANGRYSTPGVGTLKKPPMASYVLAFEIKNLHQIRRVSRKDIRDRTTIIHSTRASRRLNSKIPLAMVYTCGLERSQFAAPYAVSINMNSGAPVSVYMAHMPPWMRRCADHQAIPPKAPTCVSSSPVRYLYEMTLAAMRTIGSTCVEAIPAIASRVGIQPNQNRSARCDTV